MARSLRFLTNVSSFCAALALAPGTFAQDELPDSVDIDLRISEQDPARLEVYLRANGLGFADVVSGLTFTVRWAATSPATLGPRTNACPDAIPITAVPQDSNPELDSIPTGFNYRSYNGFGLSLMSEWGCAMLANEWYLVMTVPVENNDGCTVFNIANDAWTAANNRDYYIALGGYERQGGIEPTDVPFGTCSEDCLGQVGGTALPGTPCDDGDEETEDDAYTVECVCEGQPIVPTTIHSQETEPDHLLWPNPTNGIINVNGATILSVSDVLGRRAQLPAIRAKGSGVSTIDLSAMPAGVYLLELDKDGMHRVERVVKR